ncbi:hypothetical protein RND81_02G080400 [Saponaria officinalis]|uniref:Uncharacterized protein n=1 Tax=Saponaria officinalis TaxID=3572 RepID=A0AAW1MRN5_SAPOF
MEDDEEIQSHASHNTEEEDDDDEVVVDELKQRGDRIGNEILENSRRSLEIFIEFRLKLCNMYPFLISFALPLRRDSMSYSVSFMIHVPSLCCVFVQVQSRQSRN